MVSDWFLVSRSLPSLNCYSPVTIVKSASFQLWRRLGFGREPSVVFNFLDFFGCFYCFSCHMPFIVFPSFIEGKGNVVLYVYGYVLYGFRTCICAYVYDCRTLDPFSIRTYTRSCVLQFPWTTDTFYDSRRHALYIENIRKMSTKNLRKTSEKPLETENLSRTSWRFSRGFQMLSFSKGQHLKT